jgi:hypothetical protein
MITGSASQVQFEGPPPPTIQRSQTVNISASVSRDTAGVMWSGSPAPACGTFNLASTGNEVVTSYTAPASDRDGLYLHLRFTAWPTPTELRPTAPGFMVSQNAGVTVGVYNTKLEAQQRLEDCERDDLMLETARSLVNAAVEAQMRLHNIDS